MISNIPWFKNKFKYYNYLINWFYLNIYNWRINRSNIIELINWYYFTWYLLCSRSFSLCIIYRSSFCYYYKINSLISHNHWFNIKSKMIKNSIYYNIYWCKYNFFPSTFFRINIYTSTIFRLSRFLLLLKFNFINWSNNFNK